MIAVIDIETTGLDPERHEIWEIAYILEGSDNSKLKEESFQLPVDLENADPAALEIGGFYDRHRLGGAAVTWPMGAQTARAQLLGDLKDAVLVGNNPAFDAAFLRRFLGSAPWHYHVVDVKALVAGRLGLTPPWSSEQMFELVGMEPRTGAHTALDDAKRAHELYRYVLGLR